MKTGKLAKLVIAIAAVGVAIILLVGRGRDEREEASGKKKLPTVLVETVRKETISRVLDLTGDVVAATSVVIAATVEGPISYCPWREGDKVETAADKPVKLIEINRELYRAEVAAAEAALEVARAKLADMQAGTRPEEVAKAQEAVRQFEESAIFAKNDLERITKLVESGALSGEALEKARVAHVAEQTRLAAARRHLEMLEAGFTKTAIAVQEAAVKEAQAKLALAKARLHECIIFAPFSGTITRVHVRAGDMAAVKAPLLEMADMSSLVIRVAIPEAYATAVHEGTTAKATIDSLPGKLFPAKVVRVYPELDRRMRTRTIELTIAGEAALAPGMFARVSLALETVADAIVVPREAVLVTPAGGKTAFAVEDGKVSQRKITVGIEAGEKVQVLSGLKPGEKVVVRGNEKLKDGMAVHISEGGKGSQGKDAEKGPSKQPGKAPADAPMTSGKKQEQ